MEIRCNDLPAALDNDAQKAYNGNVSEMRRKGQ